MKLTDKITIFLASGFYVGKLPFAPGTIGTLLAFPISFLLSEISASFSAPFISIFLLISIFLSDKASRIIGKKDPSIVVIDEIVGMTLTLMFIPFNLVTAGLGFIIFRILDIFKPFPINYMEKFKGGIGIVLDDAVAGILGNIILRLIIHFFL